MAELLARTPHMKRLPEHEAIYSTFIGQAHLAGTGPEGKTCRECALWGILKCADKRQFVDPPGHYAASNKANGGLKKGGFHYDIRGKAKRRFMHFASACRFFQPNGNPPPAVKMEPHNK